VAYELSLKSKDNVQEDNVEKAAKLQVPLLSTVELALDSAPSDCPKFTDHSEFTSAIITIIEAFSKVHKRDLQIGTCAQVSLQLLKQILFVEDIFDPKYVGTRSSNARASGQMRDEINYDQDSEEGGADEAAEEDAEAGEVQLGLMQADRDQKVEENE